MTEKRQTSQGYIIRILQHFATTLRNITNFATLFQAVMKFLSRSKFHLKGERSIKGLYFSLPSTKPSNYYSIDWDANKILIWTFIPWIYACVSKRIWHTPYRSIAHALPVIKSLLYSVLTYSIQYFNKYR
jgi:hypothetical protein